MRSVLVFISRVQIIVVALAVALLITPPRADRYGDTLQIALPLLAWACAGSKNGGTEFFLRYAVMFGAAHASKAALGDAQINQRPNGGAAGFPSAHTATAVLGASALAHHCLQSHPFGQAVVILAAGFVGGSRIEAGAHDIWQVLAGALLGYGCDRALRRDVVRRRQIATALDRAGAVLLNATQMIRQRLAVPLLMRVAILLTGLSVVQMSVPA